MNAQGQARTKTTRRTIATQPPRAVRHLAVAAVVFAQTVLLCAPLGLVSAAHAHDSLIASTPQAGQTVTELPERFSITMNEAMLLTDGDYSGFALQVSDADGLFYGDGCVTVDEATMSMPSALGSPGTYLVQWQVVSADGHPVSDEFEFEWQPIEDAAPSVGSSTAPNCGRGATDPAASAENSTSGTDSGTVDAEVTSTEGTNPNLSGLLVAGGIVGLAAAVVLITVAVRKRRTSV